MKKRIVAVLGAGMLSVFIGTADAQTALVSEYCSGCHNDRTKAGGMTLTSLDLAHPEQIARVDHDPPVSLNVGEAADRCVRFGERRRDVDVTLAAHQIGDPCGIRHRAQRRYRGRDQSVAIEPRHLRAPPGW